MSVELPKNESICLTFTKENGRVFVISRQNLTGQYILYKKENSKLVKTKYKADNPLELEKYFDKL